MKGLIVIVFLCVSGFSTGAPVIGNLLSGQPLSQLHKALYPVTQLGTSALPLDSVDLSDLENLSLPNYPKPSPSYDNFDPVDLGGLYDAYEPSSYSAYQSPSPYKRKELQDVLAQYGNLNRLTSDLYGSTAGTLGQAQGALGGLSYQNDPYANVAPQAPQVFSLPTGQQLKCYVA